MKTVAKSLPQSGIESKKLSYCVAFRRGYLIIPTRQSEPFYKHICLENRLVYPENEIVLVAEKLRLLLVNIAAMTDIQNQNQNLVVLNIGNQAIIADTIAPLTAAISS